MHLATHRIVGFVALITLAACEGPLQVGDAGSEPTADTTADATTDATADAQSSRESPASEAD